MCVCVHFYAVLVKNVRVDLSVDEYIQIFLKGFIMYTCG